MKLKNSTKLKVPRSSAGAQKSTKGLKLLITMIACSVLFISGFTFAQSTGTTTTGSTSPTLTQLLTTAKNLAISNLDTTTTQFRTQNFSGSNHLETNPNYQSLVCLGILEQVQPSKAFTDAVAALRNEILQNYIDLNGKISSISLGLPVDQTKLQADITSFATNYATRTSQLISNFTTQLQVLQGEVTQYSAANQALLANLNTKIVQLNTIQQQYTILEDLIFQFNNLLLVQEGNVFDSLSDQKKQAQAALDTRLQTVLAQQLGRATNLLGLETALNNRKRDVIRLYGLDFDDAMSTVIGSWYSRQSHDTIREQMQTIRQTFYNNDVLRCQNILVSDMDVDGYARVLTANINDMQRRLATGIGALQATGSAEQLKQSLYNTFRSLYTTRIDTEAAAMRSFATEQLSIFMDRSTKQTEQLTTIQEAKKRYDANKNQADKEVLILQARSLYDAAVTRTVRDQVGAILTALGVDLTPPAPTVQTNNPFFPVIVKLVQRNPSFLNVLQLAIPVLQQRAQTESPAQKILLEQIVEAIQLYVAQ